MIPVKPNIAAKLPPVSHNHWSSKTMTAITASVAPMLLENSISDRDA